MRSSKETGTMPPKRRGPLQAAQRETDAIKIKTDALVLRADEADVSDRMETLDRCKELQGKVEDMMKTLKKLSKADEPAPVGNYELSKREEEKRLVTLQERLQALALDLQSRDETAGPSSSHTEDESEEEDSNQDDDDDDDDDETSEDEDVEAVNDDDDDDDEVEEGEGLPPSSYVALSLFKGQEDGDLSIQKGDILKVLVKNKDGWWLAVNSQGHKGLVPKTFLKEIEREDDLESEVEHEESKSKSSKTSNWSTVRKAITEMDATDVLAAMGAIPLGFRPSTLSRLLEEGRKYRTSTFIQPRLSQSQLSFKDLHLDPDTGKVQGRQSRVSLTLTLWSCRMISPPGVGIQVLSRHVRLCAFNGNKVLSNIHTIRATYSSKSPKTWSFSPRMTGTLPCLLDGDCFFRCDSESPDLGILFELGVTYIRNSTGERGDLSCGWAFLKLFDEHGSLISPRTQELPILMGTPFEKVPTLDKKGLSYSNGVIQHILHSRKQPKLVIKLKSVNTQTRDFLNLLPDTLVGSLSTLHLQATYRQILADVLLLDRVSMCNADLICNPILASFPDVLDQPDLMDAFRISWAESESKLRRSEKRDVTTLKQTFVSVYMSSVFPLLHSADMPAPCWADEEIESKRARIIYGLSNKAIAEVPQAFDISHVTYDLICRAQT